MISSRSIKLIGEENYKKVTNTKVAIFGLGGVGGTCFEALVRSGVEHFYIQDFDAVSFESHMLEQKDVHPFISVKNSVETSYLSKSAFKKIKHYI